MQFPPFDDQLVREKVAAVEVLAICRNEIDLFRKVGAANETFASSPLRLEVHPDRRATGRRTGTPSFVAAAVIAVSAIVPF